MRLRTIALTACVLALAACQKDSLRVPILGTVWENTVDNTTTWLCFHDSDSASIVQFSSGTNRLMVDHGTYVSDGHELTIKTEYTSAYNVGRTFFHLRRPASSDNFERLSPRSYASLAGSVWVTAASNVLHIAYLPEDGKAVDITYANITRDEKGPAYGWSVISKSAALNGSALEVGSVDAVLYPGIMTAGKYALHLCCEPFAEDGTSSLKGSVWVYNNTGSPADIPSVIIFNGKDSFTRISGMWTGTVSSVNISPIIFDVAQGTYSESGGTVSITIGDKSKSCPISGGSFTLSEKTFRKLDY